MNGGVNEERLPRVGEEVWVRGKVTAVDTHDADGRLEPSPFVTFEVTEYGTDEIVAPLNRLRRGEAAPGRPEDAPKKPFAALSESLRGQPHDAPAPRPRRPYHDCSSENCGGEAAAPPETANAAVMVLCCPECGGPTGSHFGDCRVANGMKPCPLCHQQRGKSALESQSAVSATNESTERK